MSTPAQPRPGPAPRYVLGTAAEAHALLARLAREGWRAREGFAVAESAEQVRSQRLVVFGAAADETTAAQAVRAAARGAGVVAVADPCGALGRALLADLAALDGPVPGPAAAAERAPHPGAVAAADVAARRRPAVPAPRDPPAAPAAAQLLPEQRALLRRLAGGETIAAAAAGEYLSLRTANRRIAQARARLGVSTTREAVLAYLRQRDDEPD